MSETINNINTRIDQLEEEILKYGHNPILQKNTRISINLLKQLKADHEGGSGDAIQKEIDDAMDSVPFLVSKKWIEERYTSNERLKKVLVTLVGGTYELSELRKRLFEEFNLEE